jgi:hypothetical protein
MDGIVIHSLTLPTVPSQTLVYAHVKYRLWGMTFTVNPFPSESLDQPKIARKYNENEMFEEL